MIIPAFTFSGFLIIMNREPKFKSIGREDFKKIEHKCAGDVFFKRDSTLFKINILNDDVFLKDIESEEKDADKFFSSYFDIKNRVEEIGGKFNDVRYVRY